MSKTTAPAPVEIPLVEVAKTRKKLKGDNVLNITGDVIPLGALVVTDSLMASEVWEFDNVEHLQHVGASVFYIVPIFLILGGVAAIVSSVGRIKQLNRELDEINNKPEERERKKQYIIDLIIKIEATKDSNWSESKKNAVITHLNENLRKLNRTKAEVEAEITFQKNKFAWLGVLPIVLGVASLAIYTVFGAVALTFLTPILSGMLTFSMAFMAIRFGMKVKEAYDRKDRIEQDYNAKILAIDNQLQSDPQNKELQAQKTKLEGAKKVELKSADEDIKQRWVKFAAYTGIFVLGLAATALSVAFVIVASPILAIFAAGVAAGATLGMAAYLGYHIYKKVKLSKAPELVKEAVEFSAPKTESVQKDALTNPGDSPQPENIPQ
jgi:hypothetical protein